MENANGQLYLIGFPQPIKKKPTKFIVTCHIDTTFPGLSCISIGSNKLQGTFDNMAGCWALSRYLSLLTKFHVPFFFTQNEEINQADARSIANTYSPDEYSIINIDVDEIIDPKVIARLDNISGFSRYEVKSIKDTLKYWFDDYFTFPHTYYKDVKNDDNYEDDAWVFAQKGFNVIDFTIPVIGKFHTDSCILQIDQFERSCRALQALLYYFLDDKGGEL